MKKVTYFVAGLTLLGLTAFSVYQSAFYKNQIGLLQNQINVITKNSRGYLANSKDEEFQTQEQLTTSAVSKITPAVVSVTILKSIPNIDVYYTNPFENDPSLKDFGFKIPVVKKKGDKKEKIGAGTGIIIDRHGYVLTNNHVVSDTDAEYTVTLLNGDTKVAKIFYQDKVRDIAILKIDGSYQNTASLGDSSNLKIGQTVIAVGNALGEYNNTVSLGIVSGLNRDIEAGDENTTATEKLKGVIQTDVSVNPGNSGGPLTDLNGDVIGINVATAIDSNNINFSIPINNVKNILNRVIPKY
ncbi:MAG: trypsin-like peptidase domain-containing protein [bacterium]